MGSCDQIGMPNSANFCDSRANDFRLGAFDVCLYGKVNGTNFAEISDTCSRVVHCNILWKKKMTSIKEIFAASDHFLVSDVQIIVSYSHQMYK